MEQPQILEVAFKIEKLFGELEKMGAETVFDAGANEAKFDAACDETQNILSEVEEKFGRAEMQKCADRVQFYLIGKDYHLGAQAVGMLAEGKE